MKREDDAEAVLKMTREDGAEAVLNWKASASSKRSATAQF